MTVSLEQNWGARPRGKAPTLSPAAITLAWMAKLRWGSVLGQVTTILVARFALELAIPLGPLLALCALSAVFNVSVALWLRRVEDVSSGLLGATFVVDVAVLYGLLYHSGGPSNPFSVFYLVHITLAALVLGIRWASGVVVLSAISYAALFFWHVPIAGMEHLHRGGGAAYSIHLQGMWVAFVLSGSLIAYFVSRVALALREREADLAKAQGIVAKAERLASLTTLAAGAAHELGSPLATIAVVAKELERSLGQETNAKEDARLIRAEVDRCRAIIERMGARTGGTLGEMPMEVRPHDILERATLRLTDAERARITRGGIVDVPLVCPPEGLTQVLLCLLQNALDATRENNAKVCVDCTQKNGQVAFVVRDEGTGIAPELLSRVGEPFLTTKPTGQGMGLGLFLARTFAEQAGGELQIDSDGKRGTTVSLNLPTAGVRRG